MSKSFQVNQAVQFIKDDHIRDGVVVASIPPKREWSDDAYNCPPELRHEYDAHVQIKFEDGLEDTVNAIYISERDSEMERTFRVTAAKASQEIDEQLSIASAAITRAEELSEKYGVPFSAGVSPLSQSYTPDSMKEKFPEVDNIFMYDLTGSSSEYGYGGWEHSAVCY